MNQRRIVFALILGLVLAVFVSACGVALGPVAFTAGGPVVLSPTLNGLNLPGVSGIQPPASLGSMARQQRFGLYEAALSTQALHAAGCHGTH